MFISLGWYIFQYISKNIEDQKNMILEGIKDVRQSADHQLSDLTAKHEHKNELYDNRLDRVTERIVVLETNDLNRKEWLTRLENALVEIQKQNTALGAKQQEFRDELMQALADLRVKQAANEG